MHGRGGLVDEHGREGIITEMSRIRLNKYFSIRRRNRKICSDYAVRGLGLFSGKSREKNKE